jgi:exodeoxyribonuclease VII large subunit
MRMTRIRARVTTVTSHRVFSAEQGRVRQHAQRVDDLGHRAFRGLQRRLERSRDALRSHRERVEHFRWDRQIARRREELRKDVDRLSSRMRASLAARQSAFATLAGKLESLSPLAVLSRGYALVWDVSRGSLLRRAADVRPGDPLRVRVHDGEVRARVAPEEKE